MENSQTNQTKQANENEGQKAPLNLVATSKKGGDKIDSQSGAGTATATARSLYDQAKETAGQAYDAVTEKAADKLNEQRTTLSGGLSAVADSVRQVSSNLGSSQTDSGIAEAAAKYTDTAARKLENVAGYFENKDVRAMARDLESFARRNPALFIGAAFGLGFVVARFLKSTPTETYSSAAGRDFASAERENRTAYKSVSQTEKETGEGATGFSARPQ